MEGEGKRQVFMTVEVTESECIKAENRNTKNDFYLGVNLISVKNSFWRNVRIAALSKRENHINSSALSVLTHNISTHRKIEMKIVFYLSQNAHFK